VRDSVLAALIPVGLGGVVAAVFLLPKSILSSYDIWILVTVYLCLTLIDAYYFARKYKIGSETIVFFIALVGVVLVVLSYVPYEIQILSFVLTAIASLVMYARIIVEFRRRKYA